MDWWFVSPVVSLRYDLCSWFYVVWNCWHGWNYDDVAGISRGKMDEKRNTPHREAKPKYSKTEIHITSEHHREKARYPRIRPTRKCHATQDPQNRLRIFQHQIMLNERTIQASREESQESKGTQRKHQTSLSGIRTLTLKARKCREAQLQRQRSPSTSSHHRSNCFAF
jgi:hypothetical protein